MKNEQFRGNAVCFCKGGHGGLPKNKKGGIIMYRSITKLSIQYAHRFLGYEGEAQYLHGHTGCLTLEIGGEVHKRTGFVYPCNGAKRIAWSYLLNFDHALILQEEDPLLPGVIAAYEKQGIQEGATSNRMLGVPFKNHLGYSLPSARLVVVKKVATCENLLELFHHLLKEELPLEKMTFSSGDNCASFCCRS